MFQYDSTDSKSVASAANCANELQYSSTGQTIWYHDGHMTEGVWFCKVSANTALPVSAIKTVTPPSYPGYPGTRVQSNSAEVLVGEVPVLAEVL
eukprot:3004472-Rhodomonas_salina.2